MHSIHSDSQQLVWWVLINSNTGCWGKMKAHFPHTAVKEALHLYSSNLHNNYFCMKKNHWDPYQHELIAHSWRQQRRTLFCQEVRPLFTANTFLVTPLPSCSNTLTLSPNGRDYAVPNRQPIRYARARNFPGTTASKTSFTANANQSNESVTSASVAGTEICACHRGENTFLPPWKLIFTTVENCFFYHHRKIHEHNQIVGKYNIWNIV